MFMFLDKQPTKPLHFEGPGFESGLDLSVWRRCLDPSRYLARSFPLTMNGRLGSCLTWYLLFVQPTFACLAGSESLGSSARDV